MSFSFAEWGSDGRIFEYTIGTKVAYDRSIRIRDTNYHKWHIAINNEGLVYWLPNPLDTFYTKDDCFYDNQIHYTKYPHPFPNIKVVKTKNGFYYKNIKQNPIDVRFLIVLNREQMRNCSKLLLNGNLSKLQERRLYYTLKELEKEYPKDSILYQASFSKLDTFRKYPFFLGREKYDYRQAFKMYFVADTIIIIKGKQIPCFRFDWEESDKEYVVYNYPFDVAEVYFEQASLLPVLILGKEYVIDTEKGNALTDRPKKYYSPQPQSKLEINIE